MVKSWYLRIFLVSIGCISLVLGVIGIAVPLLPTTPFLLLTAACFIRSSERLYSWLIKQPWLGTYIRNYRENRAMTRNAKLIMLVLLWIVISHTALFGVSELWLQIMLLVVAVAVSAHIISLKTVSDN